jgi:hypothetical protein
VCLLSSQCQEVASQQYLSGDGAARKLLDQYRSYGSVTSEKIDDDGFIDVDGRRARDR